MLRSLTHYWKINVAVLAAVVVNTAVLAGALIVGDSVRGSLRDMTLDRLGAVEQALVSERLLPQDLAERLDGTGWATGRQPVAPAILLPGSAVNADSGARSSQVSVHGVDERFVDLFGRPDGYTLERGERQFFPSVVINKTLQTRLAIEVGDAVLLNFSTQDDVPDDTLLGNKENVDTFGTLRGVVTGVIADTGVGRFGLSTSQAFPANAFVELAELQDALDQEGRINALLVSVDDDASSDYAAQDPLDALRGVVGLADLGLMPEWQQGRLQIESSEYVLRPATLQAVETAARATDATVTRVTSYLATELAIGPRAIPYSTVAALDGSAEDLAALQLADGSPAPALGDNEILLNQWAFDDLEAAVGDTLRLEYYVVGPYEQLAVESTEFVVRDVVAMQGLGADARLTPDYPGIEDTDNIADWDPPFPVELTAIRTADEDYWDEYAATPKAFVSPDTAERLWSTRYGVVTSVRLTPPAGQTPEEFEQSLETALLERLNLAQFGMRFIDVRDDGLRASSGATDFSGLFIGFSFFLIAAAAMLAGLLFSLGVEERSGEVGLLLSVGYPVAKVRRRMLTEGGLVAVLGALLGLAAGIGYAALMMIGLRTLWLPAVGTTLLEMHVTPTSLALGAVISIAVVLVSIGFTVRRLGKLSATALLKGSAFRAGATSPTSRRWRLGLAVGAAGFALAMLAIATITGDTMNPMVFGTIGFPLLVAGLAAFSQWCRGEHGRVGTPGSRALLAMAARNSAWNPGRSILSVALVAFASFVIVTVAANYRDPTREVQSLESGTGGFALFANSEIPLHADLDSAGARFDLGFEDEDEAVIDGAEFIALRAVPGDDASCLNLYRPQNPRLVGASDELVARGGFRFATRLAPGRPDAQGDYDADNPWTLLHQDLGPGVVPVIGDANSVQWILHLGLGDELVVVDELGQPLSLRIVGTFAESIFRSELLLSEENLLRYFPSRSGYSTFLVDMPAATDDATLDAASAALERALAPYGFDAERTDRKLAEFLVVQNTYLSTFQLLGGLGLLLGTVGLAVVMARNVIERRAELATLRAFGYRRSSLSRMVLAENAFLLLVGTGIGSLASLLAVAPRFVGGQFTLPWASLAMILAGVVVVGMSSSVTAVAGALRTPLLPVLKGDR